MTPSVIRVCALSFSTRLQAYVYKMVHDGAHLSAMRTTCSLEKIYEYNDGALQSILDECKATAARERGEEPATVTVAPPLADYDDPSSETSQFAIALKSDSLRLDDLLTVSHDTRAIIMDHQEAASTRVSEFARLLSGSIKDDALLKHMRESHVGTVSAADLQNGCILIAYDVKASGEDSKRPAYRQPAFRKTHLTRLMSLALQCRLPPDAVRTELAKHEVVALFDAGRDGNAAALLSQVRIGDQAPATHGSPNVCRIIQLYYWFSFNSPTWIGLSHELACTW